MQRKCELYPVVLKDITITMNTGVLAFIGRAIQYLVDNPYILGILFLLYVFIFLLSVLFSGPRPGRNPFSVKNVKPVQELITDQKSRDQILKQSMLNALHAHE